MRLDVCSLITVCSVAWCNKGLASVFNSHFLILFTEQPTNKNFFFFFFEWKNPKNAKKKLPKIEKHTYPRSRVRWRGNTGMLQSPQMSSWTPECLWNFFWLMLFQSNFFFSIALILYTCSSGCAPIVWLSEWICIEDGRTKNSNAC